MYASRALAEEVGRRVQDVFSQSHGALKELMDGGSVVYRIAFRDSKVVVDIHEVVQGELYVVAIANRDTRILLMDKVLMLGQASHPLAFPNYCLERRISGHAGCQDEKRQPVWPQVEPGAEDFFDVVVPHIFTDVLSALNNRY